MPAITVVSCIVFIAGLLPPIALFPRYVVFICVIPSDVFRLGCARVTRVGLAGEILARSFPAHGGYENALSVSPHGCYYFVNPLLIPFVLRTVYRVWVITTDGPRTAPLDQYYYGC